MNNDIKRNFYILFAIIIATDIVVLLNISFLRQIFGFFFLNLLPGLLILHILKLNKLDFVEKFVLSIGLSISYAYFFGLLINDLLFSLGYKTPLSTISLIISLNLSFILLAIIGNKVNKNSLFPIPNLNLITTEKAFLIIPVLFPGLCIYGMYLMNITDNNIILMFLLLLVPAYIVLVCFFNHKFPKRMYPVLIFLISLSLVLQLALRSNHLLGSDVHSEYYLFHTTLDNLHWSIFGNNLLSACLSISLLPTIYQSILNIQSEYLYKVLPSLLCSPFPIIIYIVSNKYIDEGYAFLASCYFMSNNVFLSAEYNARGDIALLFFALAMMMLFSDKIELLKKRTLFIVFMASCMVSHYSNTYIFFLVLVGTFIGMKILSKKYTVKRVISLTPVILFFVMIFFWYSQVTGAAFTVGVHFVDETISSLNGFFVEETRSASAQTLLGTGIMQKSIVYRIHWVLTWLTFAFIGIGVSTLIVKRKEMSFPESNFRKSDFLKDKFEVLYFVIALILSGLLVAIVSLPYVSKGYGLGRAYPLSSTILAVFFVIGGIILSKNLSLNLLRRGLKKALLKKQRQEENALLNLVKKSVGRENDSQVQAYLIILLVLIPYFLCITGAMYNMFGEPYLITLNSRGEQYDNMYVHDQETYSAIWLRDNGELENATIFTDYVGGTRLISQAGIPIFDYYSLFIKGHKIEGYIYLRYYNIAFSKLLDSNNIGQDITEYEDKFVGKSKIYDNSGSEIWR